MDIKDYLANYFTRVGGRKGVENRFFNFLWNLELIFLGWAKGVKDKEYEPTYKELINTIDVAGLQTDANAAMHQVVKDAIEAVQEWKNALSIIKQLDTKSLLIFERPNIRVLLLISENAVILAEAEVLKSYMAFLGLVLYIRKELVERLLRANKIDLTDKNTFFSNPALYVAFWASSTQQQGIDEDANEILDKLHRDADKVTKGIYHPDDPKGTKDTKFVSDNQTDLPDKRKKLRTEAEGLYDEVLVKTLHKKISMLSKEKLLEKMFEWDDDLAYLPYSYQKDLATEIESRVAKEDRIPIKTQRALNKKIKELEISTRKGKGPPEKLEEAFREIEGLIRKDVSISHIGEEDFEGMPNEIAVSNEMVEYFIKNPEEIALSEEKREKICGALQDWAAIQPKQARLTHKVVEYVTRVVNDPTVNPREAFKVNKISEALNTDKKDVRRVLNKIKEEVSFLKDL